MTILVPILLFSWVPIVLAMFMLLPPARAVIVALLVAWLFLPNAQYDLPALPPYTKLSATVVAVLLGTAMFDAQRLVNLRLGLADVPVIALCSSPFASSISNGLGAWDGCSAVLDAAVQWGLPYLVGRMYFSSLLALRELAIAIAIGGLLYVPLCLWEIRMSPGLHKWLYGFRTRPFRMSVRYGGYRPMVFMWSYLPVVHWMTLAVVISTWMWICRSTRRVLGITPGIATLALAVTTALCKSLVAGVLAPLGIAVLYLGAATRRPTLHYALLIAILAYMGARAFGLWDGQVLVEAATVVSEERAESLEVRLESEDVLADVAMQRPMLGWGRHGRARGDETAAVRTDGLWIIILGEQGLFGLIAFVGMYVVSLSRFCRMVPASQWRTALLGPIAALGVCVLLTLMNNLPNSTINPVVTTAVGGFAALSRGKDS